MPLVPAHPPAAWGAVWPRGWRPERSTAAGTFGEIRRWRGASWSRTPPHVWVGVSALGRGVCGWGTGVGLQVCHIEEDPSLTVYKEDLCRCQAERPPSSPGRALVPILQMRKLAGRDWGHRLQRDGPPACGGCGCGAKMKAELSVIRRGCRAWRGAVSISFAPLRLCTLASPPHRAGSPGGSFWNKNAPLPAPDKVGPRLGAWSRTGPDILRGPWELAHGGPGPQGGCAGVPTRRKGGAPGTWRGVVCCPLPQAARRLSGFSQTQPAASQAARAPGLSREPWALITLYFFLSL